MKIWKKIGILCLSLLMICSTAVLAVGCGERNWNEIRLNEVTHSIFYAPMYVAVEKGYFKEEGLSISITNGGGSDVSMNALVSGSADIILAGPETSVYTQHIADAPVVFGQLTTCDGSFILSKEKISNFTLEDLKGKSIIGGRPGGMPAMTLNYILDKNNIEISTKKEDGKVYVRSDINFNNTPGVWKGDNTIDFCALFEPMATTTKKTNENYDIVASLGKLLDKEVPYTCFAARKSYLEQHGDIAEKFIKAVLKGYDFISKNTSRTVAEAIKNSFEGITVDELEASVENYRSINAWSEDMILKEDTFQNLMDILLFNKTITKAADWSTIVDNTIAEKLKAEMAA